MSKYCCILLLMLCAHPAQEANAWDSVGHRLSAAIALNYLSEDKQSLLLTILRQHPRYQDDFLDRMPASVSSAEPQQQAVWLLGQAAFWPDMARGLTESEQQKYNRPGWHYIDGAWVRGAASVQGNSYLGIDAFADIAGVAAASIRSERRADNVMTALDYNSWLLASPEKPMAQRAVALCWVLHLMADIHQPLHTGSLYAVGVFANGDRGGNAISTDSGNLHARWDRALAGQGLAENLPVILRQLADSRPASITGVASDWSQWMAESRELLLSVVYSDAVKNEIAAAGRERRRLRTISLTPEYVSAMENISRQRIGLAGLRLAIWFENELN
jgi:hypothetical protein